MNGAELLVHSLIANEVDVCFANPGTSEMHFVAALDRIKGMRCVLGLFEGVVTGAADGYFRMKQKPASTLLHLGPGLANGLANLHNARKANSGILNIVGEHSTSHRGLDAPLTSDIEGIARPMSAWVKTVLDADTISPIAGEAISFARGPAPAIASLILAGDAAWTETSAPVSSAPRLKARTVPSSVIDKAAQALKSGQPTMLVLGGPALRDRGLELGGRIAGRTGCRIGSLFYNARIQRGVGRVPLERIPHAVDPATALLKPIRYIITVNAIEPVATFGYPGKPSLLKPEGCEIIQLSSYADDALQALADLATAVGANSFQPVLQSATDRTEPTGALNAETIARVLLATIPENGILVDESVSTGRQSFAITAGAAPHDTLQNMGGSIGFGTPVAVGAAIACPDRPVLCVAGDGSAMYTLQSLWTQAREDLNVTTVILANRKYQVLLTELGNVGAGLAGPTAMSMLSIDNPALDWVSLAKGMGVKGVSVSTAEDLCREIRRGLSEPGPCLIEAQL